MDIGTHLTFYIYILYVMTFYSDASQLAQFDKRHSQTCAQPYLQHSNHFSSQSIFSPSI